VAVVLTEEPYDGPVATALVTALATELGDRYEHLSSGEPADRAEEDAAYLADVTPDQVARPRGAFVVVWLDGEPVACGALRPLAEGEAEVKRMYTAPAARRRGLAARVLERLEVIAGELGYRALRLETGTPQPEAIALYERAGWQRIAPFGRYRHSPVVVSFGKELGTA
jgi:GNAT superfamily N-acetyltransferase